METTENTAVIDAEDLSLAAFPKNMLGMDTYPWQRKILAALDKRGARVALVAGNGTGKTSIVTLSLILHSMISHPGSLVVATAGAYRQLTEALWPHLRMRTNGLGGAAVGWNVVEDRITYLHGTGEESRCIAFAVTDANKAEGHHEMGSHKWLTYVIDEGKGVPDEVFDAAERCAPTQLFVTSSPGAPEGRFFKICRGWGRFETFKVTAMDCPHITSQWIDMQIEMHGKDSPLVKSMIFAEFTEEDGDIKVLGQDKMNFAVATPTRKLEGTRTAGLDFAAGGDENVYTVRCGNHEERVVKWRSKDTMATVGRFLTLIKQDQLEGKDCWADSGGMGIVMCDALRDAGCSVNRVNNGESAHDDGKYMNRGTEMWVRYARMIETGKIIPPEDEDTRKQFTGRTMRFNSKGKLQLESKEEMRSRGLGSPDRADSMVLAFMGGGEFAPGVEGLKWEKKDFHAELDEAIDRLTGKNNAVIPGCEVGY